MLWLYTIPTWQLGVLIIGVTVALSLTGLTLTRKWVLGNFSGKADFVSFYIAGIGVIYAVLLGLIAVGTWEAFGQVDDLVVREASAVGDMYRDLSGFPEPFRTQMKLDLRRYTETVVTVEWPAVQRAQPFEHTADLTRQINTRLGGFEPTTDGEKIRYAEVFARFNDVLTARRLRFLAADNSLPGVLWFVVLFGSIVMIGFTLLLAHERKLLHVVLTAGFSAMLGSLVFLMVAMDRPLWGSVSVQPDAFKLLLETTMADTAGRTETR